MKVLITGADGLLGNNLIRELLSRKYEVSVMLLNDQIPARGLLNLPLHRHFGNILDKAAVFRSVSGHDVVIHAAANTQVNPARDSLIREVNVTGTSHVIEACLKQEVKRLIHIGTANSFAPGTKQKPGDENGGYMGHIYGLDYMDSKYEAQSLVANAVKAKGLNAVIINPTFMIGPYDTRPSSGSLILALFHGKVPIYTQGSKTYVAVKDAAVAIANAITQGQVGECYILGNQNLTYKEAFDLIAETIGAKAPKFSLPTQLVKFYGIYNEWYAKISGRIPTVNKEMAFLSCEHQCYSGDKARQQLDMPCTDLRIAVKECFEWLNENGYTN
jgi:dihydroflavonol-4-reductase